jgi:CheY-like chemotaxis protein
MNADMLSRRLSRRGWEVLFAADGQAGIDSAVAEQPDIILMDLSLPAVDGWTATRILKADLRTSKIPIIVLSAHAMQADRERAFAAGCDDFQTKPVDFARLVEAIQALIECGTRRQETART